MAETEEELAARLGNSLRRAREARRWSQAALAERLDVSVDYVGMLERGERLPSFAVMTRVASEFGTTVAALIAPPADDPWLDEAFALVRAVPPAARVATLGMLQGVVAATAPVEPEVTQGSPTARKRRR